MTHRGLIANVFTATEPVYGAREAEAIARLFAERRTELSTADLADLGAARPIQYILGVADFYGLELAVGEWVLIPRPETEELVRWIVDDNHNHDPLTILDIGTGSGAIAIALAKNLPQARVTAIDVSPEALEFARRNNEKYSTGVTLLQADIFDPALDLGHFDIVVSNPPYIPESQRIAMHDNVTKYEPPTALFVSDNDPLVFYRAIARFTRRSLAENGALYLEIHEYLAHETASLLTAKGFGETTMRQDLNSKPRMIRCRP